MVEQVLGTIGCLTFFLAGWVLPLVLGVRVAKRRGWSPWWVVIGVFSPPIAWIVFLAIRFLPSINAKNAVPMITRTSWIVRLRSWNPLRTLGLALGVVICGICLGYMELPSPRYSEGTHYPSVLATRLEFAIKADERLANTRFRVLRTWGWRWGRWCASIQVWGVENDYQEQLILDHLRAIRADIKSRRAIQVEFVQGLPEPPNFGAHLGGVTI